MKNSLVQSAILRGLRHRASAARALLLSLGLFAFSPSIAAQDGIPMSGSTWGNLHYPSSAQPAESDNWLLSGRIEQGMDVYSLGQQTVVNLFGRLDYRLDTEGLDFNRKILLGVGLKLRHYFSDAVLVSLGVKYENDRRYVIRRSTDGTLLFGDWFGYWEIPRSDRGHATNGRPVTFPGMTWGEIRFPGSQDPIEESAMVIEGYAEQGVDWHSGGAWGTFNIYANFDYIADTEDIEWNNMVSVGAGMRFKHRIGNRFFLHYGVEATREHYWVTDETLDVVFAYLSWSARWNTRPVRYDPSEWKR